MVKVFLCVLTILFTSFIGWFLADKYRKRKKFFKQLNLFNERFLLDLENMQIPLPQFLDKYTYQGDFSDFLDSFRECMKSNQLEMRYSFLSKDEEELILEYFLSLGKMDSKTQADFLLRHRNSFSKLESSTNSDCSRYSSLLEKLGFLAGVLLVILFL